ncbi:hypothetical protein JCM11491_000052 [Sporobolomyces phaffii]
MVSDSTDDPAPALSPPPRPPSNASQFALATSTPIAGPPPAVTDPRVSIRTWPHLEFEWSLNDVRTHEGQSTRLARLRRVFDSIPDPANAADVPLPTTSTTTAGEVELKRWELERRTYTKELWNKCGAAAAPTSTSRSSPCLRWSSFESYADGQERLLYSVFSELDSDNNLKLTAREVEHACRTAGVEGVDTAVVQGFVEALDRDGDGMIGWEEWRDFLILLPRKPSVKEIFHYYRSQTTSSRPSMSRLTQDGDVVIGRGKTSFNRFLHSKPPSSSSSRPLATITNSTTTARGGGGDKRPSSMSMGDLHDEPGAAAVECRWAREERDRRTRKRKQPSSTSTSGLDFEGSGVVVLEDRSRRDERDGEGTVRSRSSSDQLGVGVERNEAKERKKLAKSADKEESSVTATPSSSSTPIPPTRVAPLPLPLPLPLPPPPSPSPSPSIEGASVNRDDAGRDEEEEEEEEEEHGMFAGAGKFLLAGGMAGAVSRTATAPFDRLKVYLITSPSTPPPPPPRPAPPTATAKPKKTPRRNAGSLAAAVRAVYSQGGVKAFWTGNMLNVIKIFPESAIKFLSYESAKRVFAQHWDCVPDQTLISNTSRFISGGIGGVISQLSIYPIESLKTRVMSSTGGAKRGNALIVETFLDMYRQGGLAFFFRGLPAGLIGVFPYAAIDMSTFEGIKISYTKWAGEEPGIAGSLCFGAVSGGVGATSVYPLNLVRTRLQAQGTPAHPQVYTGIRDAAIKCYQREGWRGFYKGLTPTLVKVVPAVAISYAVYDQSKRILFGKDDDHAHAASASASASNSADSLEEA